MSSDLTVTYHFSKDVYSIYRRQRYRRLYANNDAMWRSSIKHSLNFKSEKSIRIRKTTEFESAYKWQKCLYE